ncbi:MAG: helix-turn-helix transcriptional regulator [Clostridia bacterium]|nr:helix-turn-helix transcriptional regulator [Clostridia bacterium]
MDMTFGQFLTSRRKAKEIPLRRFAAMLDISPEFLCNVEKGRRSAPNKETLEKISRLLSLSKEDDALMYDLAADSKNTVSAIPSDLTGFINENRVIVAALRVAKDADATDEEWQEFMAKLQAKRADRKGDSENG